MADKVSQQGYTHVNSANTNTETATTGSNSMPSQDHPSRPRRSLTRVILFVVVLIIAHAIVIIILDMTILKARTPKYRFDSVSLADVSTNSSTTSSSFAMKLNAQVTIKNRNFGPYKYHDCYLTIYYRGRSVGEVVVKEAKVKTLSTKKLILVINVTYSESAISGRKSNLKNDISSGALMMSSKSEMRGQVKLLKIIPKDRQPKMQCTMSINLAEKVVEDLKCD